MCGRDSGTVSFLRDEAPWMVDLEGCGTHQVNLIQKELLSKPEGYLKSALSFQESFSSFLEKLNVLSLLQLYRENKFYDFPALRKLVNKSIIVRRI